MRKRKPVWDLRQGSPRPDVHKVRDHLRAAAPAVEAHTLRVQRAEATGGHGLGEGGEEAAVLAHAPRDFVQVPAVLLAASQEKLEERRRERSAQRCGC